MVEFSDELMNFDLDNPPEGVTVIKSTLGQAAERYAKLARQLESMTEDELLAALGRPRPAIAIPAARQVQVWPVTAVVLDLVCGLRDRFAGLVNFRWRKRQSLRTVRATAPN